MTSSRQVRWSRSRPVRLGATLSLLISLAAVGVSRDTPAYADASAPPPWPSDCLPQNQAPKYPPKDPFYGVPFRAIIFDGEITLPPNVVIPHLYASSCGYVHLPQLSGTITASDIKLANPNVYVAGIEAIPANVSFNGLNAAISLVPAHNGGLDITVTGSTTASVTTLGMTCGITLNASFTTKADGALSGQPVTGPTQNGQAEVVSNSFPIPAIVGSQTGTCPPAIAQTFNHLVGLPAAAGTGKFTAPFCFQFELMNQNYPPPNPNCPWPAHP